MSKVDTMSIAIVFAFAIFLVGGLVVVPALEIANADSDIQLLKNNKPKNPNHKGGCSSCGDFTIDEPVIENIHHKDKHIKHKQNH